MPLPGSSTSHLCDLLSEVTVLNITYAPGALIGAYCTPNQRRNIGHHGTTALQEIVKAEIYRTKGIYKLPRQFQDRLATSRAKELNGLLENGTFQRVNISTVTSQTRVLESRFLDEIKKPGLGVLLKSKRVAQNYADEDAWAI